MHKTLKLGDVGYETGPRANVREVRLPSVTSIWGRASPRAKTPRSVCWRRSVSRIGLASDAGAQLPQSLTQSKQDPLKYSKTSKVAQQPVFLRSANNLDEHKSENGTPLTLEVLDA
jgi:hypothetical protein